MFNSDSGTLNNDHITREKDGINFSIEDSPRGTVNYSKIFHDVLPTSQKQLSLGHVFAGYTRRTMAKYQHSRIRGGAILACPLSIRRFMKSFTYIYIYLSFKNDF